MATTVAVSRPARYQTMKLRLVMGRLSPSASELGVTSLEMALLLPTGTRLRAKIYHSPRVDLGAPGRLLRDPGTDAGR